VGESHAPAARFDQIAARPSPTWPGAGAPAPGFASAARALPRVARPEPRC